MRALCLCATLNGSRGFLRLSSTVTPSAEPLSKTAQDLDDRCQTAAANKPQHRRPLETAPLPTRLDAGKTKESALPRAGTMPRRRRRVEPLCWVGRWWCRGRGGNQALKPTQGVLLIRKLCYRAVCAFASRPHLRGLAWPLHVACRVVNSGREPSSVCRFDRASLARRRSIRDGLLHVSAWVLGGLRRFRARLARVTIRCRRPKAAGFVACLFGWCLVALLGVVTGFGPPELGR